MYVLFLVRLVRAALSHFLISLEKPILSYDKIVIGAKKYYRWKP